MNLDFLLTFCNSKKELACIGCGENQIVPQNKTSVCTKSHNPAQKLVIGGPCLCRAGYPRSIGIIGLEGKSRQIFGFKGLKSKIFRNKDLRSPAMDPLDHGVPRQKKRGPWPRLNFRPYLSRISNWTGETDKFRRFIFGRVSSS